MPNSRDEWIEAPRARERPAPSLAAGPRPFVNYPAADDRGARGDVPLIEYWGRVRKHPWLIVGIVALCTLAAFIYQSAQLDVYQAKARVLVDAENGSATATGAAQAFNDRAYFNTQLEIISTPELIRRTVTTLDLEHNRDFLAAASVRRAVSRPAPSGAGGVEGEVVRLAPYVDAIRSSLEVEPVLQTRLPVKETRLLDIGFKHPDPRVAAQVVNALADALVLSNLERRTANSASEGDFLQKNIAELRSQIRGDEERLINYARSYQILSLEASQNTVVDRLIGLNRQLMEAESERKAAEAAMGAAHAPGAAEALAEQEAKGIVEAEAKLDDLRQRRAQLLVEATEKWPEVREVDGQIAVLERQVGERRERAAGAVKTRLETQYRQALQRERAAREAFDQQRGQTLLQNEVAINYRIIQQSIDTNKNILNGLLVRAKENEMLQTGAPNNIRVVSYALPPPRPIGPRRAAYVGLAALLSLGLGVGLALALEHLDNTVRSSGDVERVLNPPAVAVVPRVGIGLRRRLLPAAGALGLLGGGRGRPELLIGDGARSPVSEAFKHLRTSILLASGGAFLRTLLVTSSEQAEGKTTTAVNMAASLAQNGDEVLIIDADLRKSNVHALLGLGNERGLSDVLAREADWAQLIQRHAESGLHVLTAGPAPLSPAELLGSAQMRRLLAEAQVVFRYVVIDSPPVAYFADGVIVSSMTDGVLLVIHNCHSSREMVRLTQKNLRAVGATVVGVVLNKVDSSPLEYYKYQHS